MDGFIKRASKGEYLRITYRNKEVALLGPEIHSRGTNASAFIAAADRFSDKLSKDYSSVSDKDIEEMRHDYIAEKYDFK